MRCDVGPEIGVGHVMRCVALAEGLAARSHEVVLVADLDSVPWARAQVARRGFASVAPPAALDDEVATVEALDPWLVVVDSYRLPGRVYADLRDRDGVLLAFTDGDPGDRTADLLLDQNIGAELDERPIPAGAVRLAGLEFALMRDDLRAHRPAAPRVEDHEVPSVFAFFGGTDAFGAAPAVGRALVATGRPFAATFVAAGREAEHALGSLSLAQGQSVEVTPPVDDLARRLAEADVVLSAAGTSSWELLCLGAGASGLVCVADNQELSYGRAVDAGLVAGLGALTHLRADPDSAARPPSTGCSARRRGVRRCGPRAGTGSTAGGASAWWRPARPLAPRAGPATSACPCDVDAEGPALDVTERVRRHPVGGPDRAHVVGSTASPAPDVLHDVQRPPEAQPLASLLGPDRGASPMPSRRSRVWVTREANSPGSREKSASTPAVGAVEGQVLLDHGRPSATAATEAPIPRVWSESPTCTSRPSRSTGIPRRLELSGGAG